MTVGIDIRVNGIDKVREAKTAIGELNTGLKNSKELSGVNVSGTKGTDAVMKGGAEAAKAMRQEIEGSSRAMKEMVKDYDRLIKVFKPNISTEPYSMGVHNSKADYYRRAAEISQRSAAPPRQTAAQQYYDQHGNYGQTVTSGGGGEGSLGSSGSGGSNFLRNALGWGLAAVGGFSALSFLAQSRSKYQQSIGTSNILGGRGITGGFDSGLGLGYASPEYMGLLEHMTTQGVTSGNIAGSTRLAAAFGRATGTDFNQVAGLYGNAYSATGHAGLGTDTIAMIEGVRKGMDKSRVSELMTMVARNTNVTASAMKGAGASDSQVRDSAKLATLTMGLKDNVSYKQFMKSDQFQNLMQNGLQEGGNPLRDIINFQLIGGYKNAMTPAEYHRQNMIRQEGFSKHPDMLQGLIDRAGTGSFADRAGNLDLLNPDMKGAGNEKLLKFVNSSTFKEFRDYVESHADRKDWSKRGNDLAAQYEAEYGAIDTPEPGSKDKVGKQRRMAQLGNLEFQTGKVIDRIIAPIQEGLLGAADKIMNTPVFQKMIQYTELMDVKAVSADSAFNAIGDKAKINTHGYRGMIETIARAQGVDPEDMIALLATENSSFSTHAVSPSGRGVGLGQVNPDDHPEYSIDQLFDPQTNITASAKIWKEAMKAAGGDRTKALALYGGYRNKDGSYKNGYKKYVRRFEIYKKHEVLGLFTDYLDSGSGWMTEKMTGVNPNSVPGDRVDDSGSIGGALTLQGTDQLVAAMTQLTAALIGNHYNLGAKPLTLTK